MAWDDTFDAVVAAGRDEPIELVGTNLRLMGIISLMRFGRVTDLINASSGYIRIREARLLRPSGEPTSLVLPELMVDQDEISFIAQSAPSTAESAPPGEFDDGFGGGGAVRKAREFVMFTPGHTVTGKIHVFGQTDLAGFVDSAEPRFVPVTDATTRSLTNQRNVSQYPFLLINRTQMIAAAEIGRPGDIDAEDVPDIGRPGDIVAEDVPEL
jgi:hypothetical protein